MHRGSMRIGLAAVAAVAVVGVAGCTSDQPTYGAASAGPTISAEPTTPDAVPSAAPSVTESSTRERVRPCVFSTGEIAKVLGLPVRPAVRTVRGPSVVCTWRSTVEPVVPAWRRTDPVTHWDDGIVTITRTDSAHYDALVSAVVSLAHRQKATGRHPLPGVGGDAFAIGASVSGVPIWHAVALAHGQAVAVEVSGADSHASQATVSDFLLTAADEG